ncbi:endolytic peptidoglycan transglycosylase [Staphylococcus phage Metroid]|nr:endolytic peptidoglycan transglycosylase [Staphylococcus phage Metroid]
MTKYAIAVPQEHSIAFYGRKYGEFIGLTKIAPTIFPNKKKAKKMLKKLNKNGVDDFYLIVVHEYCH